MNYRFFERLNSLAIAEAGIFREKRFVALATQLARSAAAIDFTE